MHVCAGRRQNRNQAGIRLCQEPKGQPPARHRGRHRLVCRSRPCADRQGQQPDTQGVRCPARKDQEVRTTSFRGRAARLLWVHQGLCMTRGHSPAIYTVPLRTKSSADKWQVLCSLSQLLSVPDTLNLVCPPFRVSPKSNKKWGHKKKCGWPTLFRTVATSL